VISPRPLSIRLARIFVASAAGAVLSIPVFSAPAPAKPNPQVATGFVLNGKAARGKAIFQQRCAVCHGDKGDGRSAVAQVSRVKPRDFTNGQIMATITDRELYLAVRDGGPAVGKSAQMLGFSGILSEREIRDVAAFVRSLARR
jgi:cytochrome c oxidase cbb3-type subunit III